MIQIPYLRPPSISSYRIKFGPGDLAAGILVPLLFTAVKFSTINSYHFKMIQQHRGQNPVSYFGSSVFKISRRDSNPILKHNLYL
jgi:hypothetical protein